MFTADQLVAHAVGDYLLQSDWMATEKTRRHVAAAVHALVYTLPFVLLTRSPAALAFVAATHFAIDRWRLARYVCWAKNVLRPGFGNETLATLAADWHRCAATGYAPDRPAWLTTWLLIIADNVLHACCNAAALRWL
jgi:hypothetical protein